MSNREQQPIFVYSLFRSGSTYLFNVFRRSAAGYWCYQEPESEFMQWLNEDADRLLEMGNDTVSALRHPALSRPYFWEIYQVKGSLAGLFRKSFSYDDFFIEAGLGLPEEQTRYFGTLIAKAQGRPLLQLCRGSGRIGAFRQTFGGRHIHLWREPRNQWWSFRVKDYFDQAVRLIYNARLLPSVLAAAKRRCAIGEFHGDNVAEEFEQAGKHPLDLTATYFAFYALWLYAFLEGEKYTDISISIDQLGADRAYQAQTLLRFAEQGIEGLDFSDCAVPRATFSADEGEFFANIEDQVRELFILHGHDRFAMETIGAAHATILQLPGGGKAELQRDAFRGREAALHYFDQYHLARVEIAGLEQALAARKGSSEAGHSDNGGTTEQDVRMMERSPDLRITPGQGRLAGIRLWLSRRHPRLHQLALTAIGRMPGLRRRLRRYFHLSVSVPRAEIPSGFRLTLPRKVEELNSAGHRYLVQLELPGGEEGSPPTHPHPPGFHCRRMTINDENRHHKRMYGPS